nr:hypothetical protein [Solirubrobacterales bacterium]
LYGSATRPSVLLLGMTRTQVRTCLGRASSTSRATRTRPERWSYGRGLSISFRSARVTEFTLNDGRFRTSRGGAGVGSPLRALGQALPGMRRDARTRRQRALVRRPDGRYADVRIRVTGGKVRQVVVSLKARSRLDAFGRSLLRRGT